MGRSGKVRLQYSTFNSKCVECGYEFGNCSNKKTMELRKKLHNKMVHKTDKYKSIGYSKLDVLENKGRKDYFEKNHISLLR
jgi:hypothetical protein